jgi:dienelactone hydrolase
MKLPLLVFLLGSIAVCTQLPAAQPSDGSAAERDLARYFEAETAVLEGNCLANLRSLEDWTARLPELKRQYQEMLGLWPMPQRTELKPVITGRIEREDFVVEKLHFQAMPRVYVTANLYLPKKLTGPAPTVLYVCGHARVVTNGVSCGNKAGYQHHGAWFARNGYVALLIDTLQLGEIEGFHHGTHRLNQWWWNSKGYTPAGVEAWFGIRALDYLCSRPEVDKKRIGMTGRSGGGSYTWTVAALDERVKVAAPVAGITDLRNHVVDGTVEGHCDCMFHVNTYRWDYPQAAALLAPRPLLIANTDKDTIFPLDGVVRTYTKVRSVYSLYGKTNQLGLLITDGPHADTQDLQVPVFRWFNRFLKGEQPQIEMAAEKFFAPDELRVFDKLPEDQLNTTLQEVFTPRPGSEAFQLAAGKPGVERSPALLRKQLRDRVFRGWPAGEPDVTPTPCAQEDVGGLRVNYYELAVQPGETLFLATVLDKKTSKPRRMELEIIDSAAYTNHSARFLWLKDGSRESADRLRADLRSKGEGRAYFLPRGVVPAKWMTNPQKAIHVRRRYMLLGQTLDSMRVWDIRCAIRAVRTLPECKKAELSLRAQGLMGVNVAYAALFEPVRTDLSGLPKSQMEGPDYLNVLTVCDLPQVLEALAAK